METNLEELWDQIYDMPDGPQKIALLEEVIRICDIENNLQESYDARKELVECAVFNGYPLKALIAFTWLISKWEEHGEELDDEYDILWDYKWIANRLIDFPQISLDQIDAIMNDMKEKYEKYGYSLREYYYYLYLNKRDSGRSDTIHEDFERWQQTSRDIMSDCKACDLHAVVCHYIHLKEYQTALEKAQPILEGKMQCAEVPHNTYARLLVPMFHLGKVDEAKAIQKKGIKLIKGNSEFLESFGEHVEFLAVTDLNKAVQVFEESVGFALETEDVNSKLKYYISATIFFEKMGENPTLIRMPTTFNAIPSEPTAANLYPWFRSEAAKIATQFDQRNGNRFVTASMEEHIAEMQ